MKKTAIIISATLLFSGCQKQPETEKVVQKPMEKQAEVQKAEEIPAGPLDLDQVLAMQSDDVKQRYPYRNPKKTLKFFRIKPGMTVIEALPGSGWYSKILQSYLGDKGTLIGVDYDYDMWPNFSFVDDAFLAKRKLWPQEWVEKSQEWAHPNGADVKAYTFADLSEKVPAESVDAVLFIRALHNLNRFEDKGQYLTKALKSAHHVLKPFGLVGVVQHEASNDKSDAWADGSRGYLKKSVLKAQFAAAGFTMVNASDINKNPKDLPEEGDIVWRLPPSLSTSKDNEALQQQYKEIGESNRMTLMFKKTPLP